MNKYNEGTSVWVRTSLANKPEEAIYIRGISDEEMERGYRAGEIVKLMNGNKSWVRSDLCDVNYNIVVNVE